MSVTKSLEEMCKKITDNTKSNREIVQKLQNIDKKIGSPQKTVINRTSRRGPTKNNLCHRILVFLIDFPS